VRQQSAIRYLSQPSVQKFTDQAMSWDDVRVFLVLARAGSLSEAARTLAVEHSTIARRVDALEQVLGVRLFDRMPRGWRLTAEGEALQAQAQRIEDEALAFERAASKVAPLSGAVRISAPPALAAAYLAPRLAEIRRALPGIALELSAQPQQASLARREADIALRLVRPNAQGLVLRALGEVGFGLYAAPAWLQLDEAQWQFTGYDESLSETPQQLWLEEFAGTRPFALRSNDLLAQREAARAGIGVALLPHVLAKGVRGLSRIAAHPVPVTRTLWLVMHPDLRRSPRVRATADQLIAITERDAALLRGPAGA
jgi:DNA-binding transcriptional LysR family regulator